MRAFSRPVRSSHPSCEGRLRPGACRKRGMTMRIARLLPAVLVAATLLAGPAGAAQPAGPTGLHGFLLRADEPAPAGQVFSRTPAFAWDPTPGATGYEFQLSTSNTYSNGSGQNVADNGIFYDINT